uniref:Putative serine proteinase n=1 Tax=Ixodes scapularis TaxID=6945 RepID=A0A4D5RL54_IXOSC
MKACCLVLLTLSLAAAWTPPDGCGRPGIQPLLEAEDRIVEGADAVPGSWPWHAGLHFNPFFDSLYFCGAVLISDRLVLTAAHCVTFNTPHGTRVHLGSHTRETRDATEVVMPVEHMCMHLDKKKDIAIVKLAQKVNFTDFIQPACLPEADSELPDRTELYVTGWGNTIEGDPESMPDVLQQTKTLSVANSRCAEEYSVDNDDEICTSHDFGSTCNRDSGGPLVRKDDSGAWVLEGLVAAGPKLCRSWKDRAMRYTKLSHFVSWIDDYKKAEESGQDLSTFCQMAPDFDRDI